MSKDEQDGSRGETIYSPYQSVKRLILKSYFQLVNLQGIVHNPELKKKQREKTKVFSSIRGSLLKLRSIGRSSYALDEQTSEDIKEFLDSFDDQTPEDYTELMDKIDGSLRDSHFLDITAAEDGTKFSDDKPDKAIYDRE
jgi:hypothetical protein